MVHITAEGNGKSARRANISANLVGAVGTCGKQSCAGALEAARLVHNSHAILAQHHIGLVQGKAHLIGLGGLHQRSICCLDGQQEERREQRDAGCEKRQPADGHFGGVHLSEGRKTTARERGDGSVGDHDDEGTRRW